MTEPTAIESLFHEDNLKILLLAGVAVLWILTATVKGIISGMARERTRREVAAYIAEGSMTPEQGEKILKAGNRGNQCWT